MEFGTILSIEPLMLNEQLKEIINSKCVLLGKQLQEEWEERYVGSTKMMKKKLLEYWLEKW